jgi:haloacid dehalogenase superfamily, subfamily IA, variant 3 with third motif having DD or ED
MIKGIFFDLGWTLFRPVNNNWFINDKLLECTGFEILRNIPDEKREKVFRKALQYLDDHHRLDTENEEIRQFQEFYRIIAHGLPELGISDSQAEEIGEYKVVDTSNYIFFDKSKETLLKLKPHYKLGIISDTWPSVDRILKSGGIDSLFDCKTYSCNLGVWKPDPRMYIDALEKMGLPPEQTVFVDDCEDNLNGAVACGINPILIVLKQDMLNSGKRSEGNRGGNNNRYPAIQDIGELPDLLEKAEKR